MKWLTLRLRCADIARGQCISSFVSRGKVFKAARWSWRSFFAAGQHDEFGANFSAPPKNFLREDDGGRGRRREQKRTNASNMKCNDIPFISRSSTLPANRLNKQFSRLMSSSFEKEKLSKWLTWYEGALVWSRKKIT